MKSTYVKVGVACAMALLSSLQAAPIEGAVLIANESVAVESLSPAALKDIYTGKTTYWQNGDSVVIVVLADETDAALKEASGMDARQFKTFWQRMVFSGRGHQPKMVEDTAALVALVAGTKGAIALAPAGTPLKSVKGIEIK